MTQVELSELMEAALAECKQISHWDKKNEWYENKEDVDWKSICKLKDRAIALYDKRWQATKAVIDLIAEDLNLTNKGHYLYAPLTDDRHPILDEIKNYISFSGDKAKLKKRVSELENENAVLRSLVGK